MSPPLLGDAQARTLNSQTGDLARSARHAELQPQVQPVDDAHVEAFAQARQQLPALLQARIEAGMRWRQAYRAHMQAVVGQQQAETQYRSLPRRL
nr:hypothetical protein [Variovorax boronicumulans]